MKRFSVVTKRHNIFFTGTVCSVVFCFVLLSCWGKASGVRVSEEEVVGKPALPAKPPSPTLPKVAPEKAVTKPVTKPSSQPTGEKRPIVSPKPPPPPKEIKKQVQRPAEPLKAAPKTSPRKIVPKKPVPRKPQPKPPVAAARIQAPPSKTVEKKEETKEISEKKTETEEEERSVTIDFDNVDILLFVKFISEVTGKNFIIDRKVKGKVTIISPTKISVSEAYRVFESVLEVHGFTTIESGDVIKIVPSVVARGKSIETRLKLESDVPEDKVVTQLIRLKYANPDELKKLFAPLISKSSVMVSYAPSGMLIVTDVLSNILRLLRIIETIDVVGIGAEISVIALDHASASDLVKTLTTVFQSGRRTTSRSKRGKAVAATTPDIQIVSDDRTNALIVSASEYDTERIKALIRILDQETPRGMGNIRVHYLQYADAEELAKVLTSLPGKDSTAKGAKAKVQAISKDVKIVADKATNSLVITTTRQDYITLTEVIEKLDIPRAMVYLESLIMEVKATKDFRIGTEWRVANDNIGQAEGKTLGGYVGSVPGDSMIPTTPNLPTGLSMGVLGESITVGGIEFPSLAAVARAFQSDSDVHILQTPQILTTDNEEAEIQVADNVPYLTKEASGDQEYQTYEYRDVGLTLKITPQINQERFVRLKVFQEYSTLSEGSSADRPTTLKRTADTTVIVKDKETVVIGGLVGDQISRGTSGVPCLGNIPVLGWAFKAYTRAQDKTNLFIFITPHVIQSPEEAQDIYVDKKEGMEQVEEGVIKMYQKTRPPIEPEFSE